jgi:hypothetical protein
MTTYELTLRDGSKRIEQAASVKDVKALLWMFDGIFAVPLKKGNSQ